MRKAAYIVGGILLLLVLIVVFFRPSEVSTKVAISGLLNDLRAGRVERIEVRGYTLDVTLTDGSTYRTDKEPGSSILTIMAENDIDTEGIDVFVYNDSDLAGWLSLLINFIPALIFLGILIALIRAVNSLNRIAK